MNNRYRIYMIILSEIKSVDADCAFAKLIQDKKFDWWRRTALNWIVVTPITISTNNMISYLSETYGVDNSFFVLEININDFGGIVSSSKEDPNNNLASPFIFFNYINSPDYIPAWER